MPGAILKLCETAHGKSISSSAWRTSWLLHVRYIHLRYLPFDNDLQLKCRGCAGRIWKLITNYDQIANEAAAAERRREKRVNLTFSIAISTFNRNADLVAERTRTIDISENGCRFATRLPLERGNVLAIALVGLGEKTFAQEKSRRFEVMWTAEQSNVRIVGARQTDGDTLWNVSFPTTKDSLDNFSK